MVHTVKGHPTPIAQLLAGPLAGNSRGSPSHPLQSNLCGGGNPRGVGAGGGRIPTFPPPLPPRLTPGSGSFSPFESSRFFLFSRMERGALGTNWRQCAAYGLSTDRLTPSSPSSSAEMLAALLCWFPQNQPLDRTLNMGSQLHWLTMARRVVSGNGTVVPGCKMVINILLIPMGLSLNKVLIPILHPGTPISSCLTDSRKAPALFPPVLSGSCPVKPPYGLGHHAAAQFHGLGNLLIAYAIFYGE